VRKRTLAGNGRAGGSNGHSLSRNGVLNGKGASLLDGYMEYLARIAFTG